MNQTMHRILTIGIVGVLFYIFIWPFLNSFISGNYYIKAQNEGNQTMYYAVRVGNDLRISAEVHHYNNVASESQDSSTDNYNAVIDYSTYEKIKAIMGAYSGFHLFARHHTGYAFYYDTNDSATMFYRQDEKSNFFELAEVITYIARGDEKIDSKRISSPTYGEKGLERLSEIYNKLDL